MSGLHPTELTALFRQRRERDEVGAGIAYSGYDIFWPDGRPVCVGLRRFCQHGTRLLLGRNPTAATALVRLSLYPVAGLEAVLTRPGPGVRCRRFYAIREPDHIRLYFLTGQPTEIFFDPASDDPEVLHWLQVERMRADVPFWFDLACQTIPARPAATPCWQPSGAAMEAGAAARPGDA
jgi:hypothetical protein